MWPRGEDDSGRAEAGPPAPSSNTVAPLLAIFANKCERKILLYHGVPQLKKSLKGPGEQTLE